MSIRIFLSHSSNLEDSDLVQNVVKELKKNDFDVYVADREIRPGISIAEKISSEINIPAAASCGVFDG